MQGQCCLGIAHSLGIIRSIWGIFIFAGPICEFQTITCDNEIDHCQIQPAGIAELGH